MTINFVMSAAVSAERRADNAKHAISLGYPVIRRSDQRPPPSHHPVAAVGAGPSIENRLDELRSWPGEIWAVNGAARYLGEAGIPFTFLTICSVVQDLSFLRPGDKAMIGMECDPEIFAQVKGCDVRIFHPHTDEIVHLTTSVTTALHLSWLLGHPGCCFFGCESSFPQGRTHVNEQMDVPDWLVVRCGGNDYLTNPQMWIQADALSQVIRRLPHLYSQRSGGLLGALVEHEHYELIDASPAVHAHLQHTGKMAA